MRVRGRHLPGTGCDLEYPHLLVLQEGAIRSGIEFDCVPAGVAAGWRVRDRLLQLHRNRPRAFNEPLLDMSGAPWIEQHVAAWERFANGRRSIGESASDLARGKEVRRRIPGVLMHRGLN